MRAFHEFEYSADRITAIVGSAILDNELQRALLRRLINDKKTLAKFFDGPALESDTKIQTCYLLGVYGEEVRDNLAALNTIRNRFAHRLEIHSFDDRRLKELFRRVTVWNRLKERDKINELLMPEPIQDNATRRERFIATVNYLYGQFLLDAFVPREGSVFTGF